MSIKRFTGIALLFIFAITICFVLIKESANETNIEIVESEYDIKYGNEGAEVIVIMFSSYQCVFCRQFIKDELPLFKNEYVDSSKLQFIIKPVEQSSDQQVLESLKLTACINKFGNVGAINKLLLSEPDVVYTKEFDDLIHEFIDKNDNIAECMLAGEAENYFKQNLSVFKELGLTGTPVFIINNKIYRGYRSFDELKKIIDKELE